MKVIVAGYPKTGTKTLCAALTILGYNVYDYLENGFLLSKDWGKILTRGWTVEDIRQMYENVDAVTDVPACYFWEEIHKAFPEAKIILTTRDDEDTWYESFERQLRLNESSFMAFLMVYLSPTCRRAMNNALWHIGPVVFGMTDQPVWKPFRRARLNKELLKMKYRAHNAHVLQNAPPQKLLQFKCRQGWGPLCDFLGLPVPDEPFPHKNKKGEMLKEVMASDPIMLQIRKEVMVSLTIFTATTAVAGYFLCTQGPRAILETVHSKLCAIPSILGFQ